MDLSTTKYRRLGSVASDSSIHYGGIVPRISLVFHECLFENIAYNAFPDIGHKHIAEAL